MDGPALAFPRPGRALKFVLVLYAVLGVLVGLVVNLVPHGGKVLPWVVCVPELAWHRPWTLLTAGLITSWESYTHLLFTLAGFYFLGPELERQWGPRRFLRFLGIAVVGGFALALLLARFAPDSARLFHPGAMLGPGAALAALGVAWGREKPYAQIRLFFVLPISGRALVWITLGFCALGLVYPNGIPEGVVAPFGGFIVGLLFAGSPSPLRAIYLRMKLALLRRGAPSVKVELRAPPKKARPGAPPLRVVYGGLEDELQKRKPPKDKRYLN